jgi:hypothetical protein
VSAPNKHTRHNAHSPDLTGQTFGRLVVLGRDGIKHGGAAYLCRCACGKQTTIAGRRAPAACRRDHLRVWEGAETWLMIST